MPQAGGRRPVFEHMTEIPAASGAMHFRPRDEQLPIGSGADGGVGDGQPSRVGHSTFRMSEEARETVNDPRLKLVHRFFAGTGATYDVMVNLATLGIDRRWKRRIVERLPPHPSVVLDLACGTGISTLAVADRYPRCRVVGVELREEYLERARRKVRQSGRTNVEFVLSRAEDYDSSESFDCVTSSYLAKYADLKRLTRNTYRMLKPGGLVLMHDFTYPPKPSLVLIWRLYFWTLQHLGSRLFPSWREIYYGLPKLIEETRWVPELTAALEENGFMDIRLEYLTAYGSAIVTARKESLPEPPPAHQSHPQQNHAQADAL